MLQRLFVSPICFNPTSRFASTHSVRAHCTATYNHRQVVVPKERGCGGFNNFLRYRRFDPEERKCLFGIGAVECEFLSRQLA
jgi:hypothetical protein